MDRVTRHMVFQFPHTRDHSDQKTRLKSPSYFLERGKDVWNPSPDRESQLEVVRSGNLYDLRAYRGERKPSKLYEDDEPDPYRLQPPNISPQKAKELEDKRKEVIRGQVVRKSSTMAEKWSSMDELNSITTESIDREQINFSAARQQFLMLEKNSPGVLFSPGYATSPRPETPSRGLRGAMVTPRGPHRAGWTRASTRCTACSTRPQGRRRAMPTDGGGSAEGSGETPIEREIRRALEREESLWKERGMQRLTSSSELVEIQTKPLLSLHTAPAQGRKGKDKGRASFNVQREIEKETKREEDLRRQGRLPGLYDRGTPQELGELRRVFEQEEQQPLPGPTPSPVLRREHFALSFWQPRISVSDGMGTRSAAGRELSPDGEHGRDEQYTLRTWRPQRSALIEEEIRSDLQREEELQEQRRRRLMDGGDGTSRESSRSRHSSGKGRADPAPRVRGCPPGDRSAPGQGGTSGCGDPHAASLSLSLSAAASGASGSYSVSGSPVSTPQKPGVLGLVTSFTPLRLSCSESSGPDSVRCSPSEERRRRTKEEGKVRRGGGGVEGEMGVPW
uniref:A-kinase anchor protein 2 C-terminal domain-containing protein n=1 Tax=Gallus gallus TaxID=9031 RepID=A0A8V1AEK2_CHICK